jgi:SAM-dependent MidA family methyltransferase
LDSISERKHKHNTSAASAIRAEIERASAIPFARFMELALYHPEHGYYSGDAAFIGKSGDFFTSVSVGSLFGEMLAFWLARELEPPEGAVKIVEAGAHDGALAADILNWLRRARPALADRLEYWIIEPIPSLERRQRQNLKSFPEVRWSNSIDALPPIRGAIISNELLDAFPVHFFQWNDGWSELGIALNGERFVWAELETLPEWACEPLDELSELQTHLPELFTIELSPAAEDWWRKAADKLENGLMLAIDYGDEAEALWARGDATARSFRGHRQIADVLANPGGQDITASVNFSRIRKAGEAAGLSSQPLQTQSSFLTAIAGEFFSSPPLAKQARQFQTLTHPEHLGRAFKVFVQRRPK